MQKAYDIVIVGGAMAGVTAAISLHDQTKGKLKIAILERQAPQQHQNAGFDARAIALSAGSCQRFAQIKTPDGENLWDKIKAEATPIDHIHVSDQGHFGMLQFSKEEFKLEHLGAVVELAKVGNSFIKVIEQCENIDYLAPVEIENIDIQESKVTLKLKDQGILETQLLIGADGTFSQVAKSAGISQEILTEYEQTAIITNVLVQAPHKGRAFERFTSQGPVALLPMQNNLMSLVWCVKDPEHIMSVNEEAFLAELQKEFGWRLGRMKQCGERFAYPLNLYCASQRIQHRVALIGNAVQTLHPIAGQGFNLGIRDVTALVKVVAEGFNAGQDFASYQWLQRYADIRTKDQDNIITLTNGLVAIFANDLLPLQGARNIGLFTLANCSLLRKEFAKPTLGWV